MYLFIALTLPQVSWKRVCRIYLRTDICTVARFIGLFVISVKDRETRTNDHTQAVTPEGVVMKSLTRFIRGQRAANEGPG